MLVQFDLLVSDELGSRYYIVSGHLEGQRNPDLL